MARALITVPKAPRRGEEIEIRVLIAHPMETGHRVDATGRRVPRSLIRRFTCHYDGELVLAAELHPAVAANPYFAFHTIARDSGTLTFVWQGDDGFAQTESVRIDVT
ncbi:MAG TPA: thiosulfate oxidation carrier complex protein SoxZ [Quisquiliibacterium sp.]|nr:thiosulfate oxidation carrier complex protein SoxZ [Quisquiliibacterium sp.]HQP67496.1 thiosulfate oxidation carrier complex protein SoxZ [Quisquiliibacterium sp.]